MRILRWSLAALLGTAVIGCGDNSTGPANRPTPNYIRLQSDAGDYIGAGQSYDYSLANAVITLTANAGLLSLSMRGDQWWYGNFAMPSTMSRLQPGVYANAQRSNDATHAGLDWYGVGRGCNTVSGSLTIDSLTYAADTLQTIDLRFEQHCGGVTPALRGTIHWRSDDTTKPPGPVTPIPATLWQPAPGATPSSGTYVYLNSEAGDGIGVGQVLTYTSPTSSIVVSANGGLLGVNVDNSHWLGDFQTMNSISTLQVGYYGNLIRYPFHNPARGGLTWWGEGRGCNTLTGWFALDRVTYVNDVLTSFDLRFEQHCEGAAPALHGAIHWDKP